MKKIISLFLAFIMVLTLVGCGDNTASIVEENASSSTTETTESSSEESTELYDTVDYCTYLYMRMDGKYTCSQSGTTRCFYDGETIISYCSSALSDGNNKSPEEKKYAIDTALSTRMSVQQDNMQYIKVQDKTINGFYVSEFEGKILDLNNMEYDSKIYTFVCEGYDCIIVAVAAENTADAKAKMENDLDTFMNNLKQIKP